MTPAAGAGTSGRQGEDFILVGQHPVRPRSPCRPCFAFLPRRLRAHLL